MASIVRSLLQTTFAAVSFAGAGYLFKAFDKSGYEAEVKRHNKALEELAKAKEAFYQNEVKEHDRIQQFKQQLAGANNDIEDRNRALAQLRQAQLIQYNGQIFDRESQLNDFYHPSDKMKEYQYITIGVVGVGTGYLVSRYI